MAEHCLANTRRYLSTAATFEAAGKIALADAMGDIAADYLALAIAIDELTSVSADQGRHNINLITAAPDLYAAVKALVSVLERCDADTRPNDLVDCTDDEWDAALALGRAALAQAEGS